MVENGGKPPLTKFSVKTPVQRDPLKFLATLRWPENEGGPYSCHLSCGTCLKCRVGYPHVSRLLYSGLHGKIWTRKNGDKKMFSLTEVNHVERLFRNWGGKSFYRNFYHQDSAPPNITSYDVIRISELPTPTLVSQSTVTAAAVVEFGSSASPSHALACHHS